MTTTTAEIAAQVVADADAAVMRLAHQQLVKWGVGSVRASWRFGQTLDSFSDAYTRKEIAGALRVSVSTVQRYLRFYHAYQRPELAEQASASLETYNIDALTELQDGILPRDGRGSLAGRRFRYRCEHCHSTEIRREEITDEAEAAKP